VFGPALQFGLGGHAGRVADDRAAGLPPLNTVLARDIVRRSRAGRALAAAELDAACRTLVQAADLVTDLGDVASLELDPLRLYTENNHTENDHTENDHKENDHTENDVTTLVALRARIVLGAPRAEAAMAIRPYP